MEITLYKWTGQQERGDSVVIISDGFLHSSEVIVVIIYLFLVHSIKWTAVFQFDDAAEGSKFIHQRWFPCQVFLFNHKKAKDICMVVGH